MEYCRYCGKWKEILTYDKDDDLVCDECYAIARRERHESVFLIYTEEDFDINAIYL